LKSLVHQNEAFFMRCYRRIASIHSDDSNDFNGAHGARSADA
jgi:hypothetical protein